MKTPDEIKKGLECCIADNGRARCEGCPYAGDSGFRHGCMDRNSEDALAYIMQLEEDKKRLQERICNQRRQLKLLHAMYEWALSVLQKAKMNDRAKFQRYLLDRGIDLNTDENAEAEG